MARVIAAHDLSGVGRCSLTTALAVLPAFGHACYPLPTAVLSKQTAFPGYNFWDFTPHMTEYIEGWQTLKFKADLIYTGFLGNGSQAEIIAGLITAYPDALCVIDPVMGDCGEIYGCYRGDFVDNMRLLAKSAHILLPNMTEFNLLAGISPSEATPETDGRVLELASSIGSSRLKYIVVTSAPASGGGMCNLLIDIKAGIVSEIACRNSRRQYSGAGDLFASVFCAFIAGGAKIEESIRKAADFVADSVEATPVGADPRYGVEYERLLAKFAASEVNRLKEIKKGGTRA